MEVVECGTCPLCEGEGVIERCIPCPICGGTGMWIYVAEDNFMAMLALMSPQEAVPAASRELCARRIEGITPDTLKTQLAHLGSKVDFGSIDEQHRFDELQKAGVKRWGWAWLNANRFAIELSKMNKVPYAQHRYALSSMVWGWLELEGQKKVGNPGTPLDP